MSVLKQVGLAHELYPGRGIWPALQKASWFAHERHIDQEVWNKSLQSSWSGPRPASQPNDLEQTTIDEQVTAHKLSLS